MKIGIWINSDYNPQEGGGFSYYERLVRAIDAFTFNPDVEVCFVTFSKKELPVKKEIIHLNQTVRKTFLERVKCHIPFVGWHYSELASKRVNAQKCDNIRRQLTENDVKLLFYPTAGRVVPNFPFITTNWDIGHLSTFAFPEVSMDGQFEQRNHYYTTVLPQALLVFCESEAGRQELLKFTNIKDDKLRVVPIFAGGCIDVVVSMDEQQKLLNIYGLKPRKYFFYPAQFWAHKNHYTLLTAFAEFVKKHNDYKLVLTGSDKGNLSYIIQLINDYNLNQFVVFPGFVSQETIYTFYKNATALIMASYFGPTNMPPLEAMALDCPVICTNLAGHKEQLEDAALYFDAQKPETLLPLLEKINDNYDIYRNKIHEQQKKSVFNISEAVNRINQYFAEAVNIRKTWK
ncbi:MAG: glycosyltransferase family 4 protein [Paludibacteraceae bacterium]|nr:glycosyltransferase family 4 protein [Paludibacteraceae bacterium]